MKQLLKHYATIKKACVVIIQNELILLDWNNCDLEDETLIIYEGLNTYHFDIGMVTDILKLVSEKANKEIFIKYRKMQLSKLTVIDGGKSLSKPTGQLHLVDDTKLKGDY